MKSMPTTLAVALLAASVAAPAPAPAHAVPIENGSAPQRSVLATHHAQLAARARNEATSSDEAREYVSLGAAVEHVARQQREHAHGGVPAVAEQPATLGWRITAALEAVALAVLSAALVLALRGRRRADPGA